jgi:hypothetical protein
VSIQLTFGDATFRFLTALRQNTPTAFKKIPNTPIFNGLHQAMAQQGTRR